MMSVRSLVKSVVVKLTLDMRLRLTGQVFAAGRPLM